MLRLSICLALLSAFPITAEIFEGLNYEMPASAQNWKIGNEMKSEKSDTVIYIPEGGDAGEIDEFFGLNANRFPLGDTSAAAIKKALEQHFGDGIVEVRMIDRDKNGSFYEWWLVENGEKTMHGWTRGFLTKDGSVILSYQTMNPKAVEQARKIWMPVLKSAKLEENSR